MDAGKERPRRKQQPREGHPGGGALESYMGHYMMPSVPSLSIKSEEEELRGKAAPVSTSGLGGEALPALRSQGSV